DGGRFPARRPLADPSALSPLHRRRSPQAPFPARIALRHRCIRRDGAESVAGPLRARRARRTGADARARVGRARADAKGAALPPRRRVQPGRDRGSDADRPAGPARAAAPGASKLRSSSPTRRFRVPTSQASGSEPMNCRDIALLLDDADIRKLTSAERTAVGAHLAGCSACADAWQAHEALCSYRIPAMRSELPARIRQRLRLAPTPTRSRRLPGRPILVGAFLLAGAAAAMVALEPWKAADNGEAAASISA